MPTKWCHGVPAGIPWELTITTDGVSSPTRKSPGELRKIPVFTPRMFLLSLPRLLCFYLFNPQLSESLAFSCTIFLVNSGTRDINTVTPPSYSYNPCLSQT